MTSRIPAALLTTGLLLTLPLSAQTTAEKAAEAEKAATPPIDPATVKNDSSYGFGYRSGRQFAQQTSRFGLSLADLDREIFMKAFFDGAEESEPTVSEDKINAALQALGEQLQAREKAVAEQNLAAGNAFLEENKKREGVTTTESGLQYEVLKKGEGAVYQAPPAGSPPANKQFMVKYRGTLIDGTEFDKSPEGETVPMTLQVIPGFKEALTSMPVGSKWKLFIPANLAYGEQRRGPVIKPNSALIFELELDNIQDAPSQPNFAIPPQGQGGQSRPRAVSPPVRVPTRPADEEAPKDKE
ncbi:MAG: FKBP-type peptidyl-prolyl cis-trans isomerase [Akkermansiaceae bacterium]|nr:FKBP-type peptidyl-prolyl cis-trans isomerase [Akkermansiaceae bacterium]